MAIDLDALFTQLGRCGKLALLVNQHQAALPAALEGLITLYDGTTPPGLRDVMAPLIAYAGNGAILTNQQSWLGVVQQAAQQTVIRTVRADRPSAAGSLGEALAEVIRQMTAASKTVQRSATTATATAGTNRGDGVCVISAKRGDGRANELLFPEAVRLECTADSFGGGRAAGAEGFTYFGQVGNPANVWGYDWPAGSGVAAGYSANPPGTYLLNGSFDTFTVANTPDSWTIASGVAGTQVLQDISVFYDGTSSVRLPGNATLASLTQQPATALTGQTPYAVVVWVRVSGVPAAGVLTVDLCDSTGTTTQDEAGTSNSFTQSLPALAAATWTPVRGVFITPRQIATGTRVRLRLTTALSGGTNLNLDRAVMTPLLAPYAGGPGIAVVGGASPFAAGDAFSLAMANDRGGASYCSTFQAFFDRAFGMRSLGLQLGSSNSPTLADTLITS